MEDWGSCLKEQDGSKGKGLAVWLEFSLISRKASNPSVGLPLPQALQALSRKFLRIGSAVHPGADFFSHALDNSHMLGQSTDNHLQFGLVFCKGSPAACRPGLGRRGQTGSA